MKKEVLDELKCNMPLITKLYQSHTSKAKKVEKGFKLKKFNQKDEFDKFYKEKQKLLEAQK